MINLKSNNPRMIASMLKRTNKEITYYLSIKDMVVFHDDKQNYLVSIKNPIFEDYQSKEIPVP